MFRWTILIAGCLFAAVGTVQGVRLIINLSQFSLTDYGRGYLFGSILLAAVGIVLIFTGLKFRKH
jgi:FtsH-binding integral membrane protein